MISSTGSISSRTPSNFEISIDVPTPGTVTPISENAEPISPTAQALKLERYLNAGEMLPGYITPPIADLPSRTTQVQQTAQHQTKVQRVMAWAAAINFSAAMPALLLPMFVGPIGFILPGILLAAALVCAAKMKMSPGQ